MEGIINFIYTSLYLPLWGYFALVLGSMLMGCLGTMLVAFMFNVLVGGAERRQLKKLTDAKIKEARQLKEELNKQLDPELEKPPELPKEEVIEEKPKKRRSLVEIME